MKKNDNVEFIGHLPKKISNLEKPVYGTIVNTIGKDKAIVKPRYKRYTVVVKLSELNKIPYDVFNKKQQVTKKASKSVSYIAAHRKSFFEEQTERELFCKQIEVKEQLVAPVETVNVNVDVDHIRFEKEPPADTDFKGIEVDFDKISHDEADVYFPNTESIIEEELKNEPATEIEIEDEYEESIKLWMVVVGGVIALVVGLMFLFNG